MAKNIRIPFVDISTDVPLIKLKIGDYETSAVIDTGAESTVIDKTVLENCPYEEVSDVETNFVGIAGNVSDNTKAIRIYPTVFDEYEFTIDGFVSDIGFVGEHFRKWCDYNVPISVIIGSDTLAQYGVIINYEKGEILMHK